MGGLRSLAIRSLAARRGRTALSIVGIALGVGVLFASVSVDAGIDASIARTVTDLVGRADLRVQAFGEDELPPGSVSDVDAAPGVIVAAPAIERRTYLAPAADSPLGAPEPVTLVAIDPTVEPRVRDLVLVEGVALRTPDDFGVLVTERLAAEDGLALGSRVGVQGPSGPVELEVVGILEGDGPGVGSVGRTVVVPLRTAQRILETDRVTRIDVVVGEGATPDEVAAALEVALTDQPYVLSAPRDVAAALRGSTADFRSTTALISAVALFVGAFLIFNTLSMTVAERVRELGLLRAAGATRDQVVRFVLIQSIVIGLLGAVLGVAVGLLLAELMAIHVRSLGSIPFERVEPSAAGAVVAIAVGLAVTVAASLEPARRAASIPPVEALKDRIDPISARRARLRWLVVVFVAVGVAGIAAWPRTAADIGLVRAIAVYAVLLAAVLVSPLALGGLSRLAGLPFSVVLRLEERLARASLQRDRSRTVLTVGALTIGLAMIVAVGGVAHQSRTAAAAWLVEVIPGDDLVTSIQPIDVSEPGHVGDLLADVDGVARVSPIASFEVAHLGVRLDAAAVVGADLLDDGRLRFAAGSRAAALAALDAGGAVVLPASVAERTGLGVEDTLTLALGGGRVLDLRVVGIAERTLPGRAGETVLLGWRDAVNHLGVRGADAFAVRYEPGRAEEARPALHAEAIGLALEPNPLATVAGAVDAALVRVFGLFDALALVAVIVAALGIVNTLSMSVLERVRELGVLRAAGMTTRQVRRTVVVEAGILGIVGAILGIGTGLVAGALLVLLSGGGARLGLELPWASIGLAAAVGIGVSMLAAWYPARLASRLAIVQAVQHE